MRKKVKKVFSLAMAAAIAVSGISFTDSSLVKAAQAVTASAESTIPLSDTQEGVMLQCWNWSFNTIAENMEKIASLGYTAVQTSPIQQAVKSTKDTSAKGNWYWLYQPINFSIDDSGNSALGTKAEFEAMCAKAHEYGIKVIVDIVPNHLAEGSSCKPNSLCMDDLKNDASCWHTYQQKVTNNNDRLQLTQYCSGGLPDLNTGSEKVQNYVIGFMKECIDCGTDGFRFDSAKHIETSKDAASYASDFWKNVITATTDYAKTEKNIDLYCYGEVLNNPYTDMSGYTDYISVTDTGYSDSNTSFIKQGGQASIIEWSGYNYEAANNSGRYPVVWAESHDTWANTDGATRTLDEKYVKLAWAYTASRANATPLYFARTAAATLASSSVAMGAAAQTGWCTEEVAVVNRFHNYFSGEGGQDAVSSDGSNILVVERKTDDKYGVSIVNCAGTSAQISQKVSLIPNGKYSDDVSGAEFKVENGVLTGNVGDKGYAMVYLTEIDDTFTVDSFKATANNGKVKLTAKATGSNLNYKFYVKKSGWTTVIKDFSDKNTATWTPEATGKYTLYVDVKGVKTTVTKKLTYNVRALSIKNFKTSSSSNQSKVKKKITLTASAAGGIGTVKYQFAYKLSGKTVTIKKYSTTKKVGFTPKKKGSYVFVLSVKDGTGKVKTKTIKYKVN